MTTKTASKPIPKSARTIAWIKPNKKLSRAHSIVRGKGSEITFACGSPLPSFDGVELLFNDKSATACNLCEKRAEGVDQ